MNEFLSYLMNLGKFCGFCLVALIFSQFFEIKISHNMDRNKNINHLHQFSYNSSPIKVEADLKTAYASSIVIRNT